MAYCESCNKKGFDPRVMRVDTERRIFVGPCCAQDSGGNVVQLLRQEDAEVDYGLEVSKHLGVLAYAEYGGLRLEFRRTAEEVKKFWESCGTTPQVVRGG